MGKIKTAKNIPVSIKIVGLILSESYQKCKIFVEKLRKRYNKKFLEPVSKGYLEMDWVEYLNKLRKEVGGQTWAVKRGVVVFLGGEFLGGEEELFTRFSLYVCDQPTPETIKREATHEYLRYLKHNNLLYTYLELSLDGQYMGSLLFELRVDLLPKTSVWFAMLCDPHNHLGYSYKNTTIYRVCQRGWFQGGKLGLGAAAGFLEDESFCYKHDRRGILSMNNYGKDSNRAQFFVTFKPSQWMDEYYVAFGRVVEGSDVLRRLEFTECSYEHPVHEITISNCGLVGAGFGNNLVVTKKLKGITVGDPHIHLETFMQLVLERFDEILFERLDEEVKRELNGEWIGEMLWQKIQPQLMTRQPIEDVLDINDKSSAIFDPAMFIKGLYGLQEIPDHFIMELLNEIITDSVDVVDTKEIVESIINLIVDNLDLEGHREVLSIKNLVTDVNTIVYGQENSKTTTTTREVSTTSIKELFQRSLHKVASQTPTIRKLLTEYSTYSLSQASYAPEEEVREATPNASTNKEQLFKKSAQKVASVSTIRKLLTDYSTLSVSQASVLKDDDEHVEEELTTEVPVRGSLSAVVSHSSTVRKLMMDYKRLSESGTESDVNEDRGSETSSTRESIVGYIWETLFRSLKV